MNDLIKDLLDLTEEMDLEEKVFDEKHYTWFDVTQPISLSRRGKMDSIEKGDVIGVRRATSAEGKYRVVTKNRGPSIIWSIDQRQYDQVKQKLKALRGSL